MKLQVGEIVVDETLYPRNQADWLTVYRYQEAMEAGSVFPPIVVGKKGDIYVLLDGRHRLMAWKNQKAERVPVIVSQVSPKEFFAESVRLNAANGRPLTTQERVAACVRLRELGYSDGRISAVVLMPVDTIRRMIADRVIETPRANGATHVVLKAPVAHIAEHDHVSQRTATLAEASQRTLAAKSQAHLLQQVLVLFEHGLMDETDEEIVDLVKRLQAALRQWGR